MTKHATFERTAAALRDLDPAGGPLTEAERERAGTMRDRLLRSPVDGPAHAQPVRRRRRLLLAPAALLAAAALAVPTVLGGGSAFASWTASPSPLKPSDEEAAATTCRSLLDVKDRTARVVVGERRGGWTYLLLDSRSGEAACLMPDELLGTTTASPDSGFFGSYDTDPPAPPTPAHDSVVETESAGGAVSLPGRLSLGSREGWFTWTSGYAGSDVTAVTVHPPTGPAVEASLVDGRFAAWWPSGEARGDNPGVSGAWTYTVTLADGTTREVDPSTS